MPGLPLVGDEYAGYRVRSVLGRGGMSVVYQAENLRLSNVIALKVLAPELADDDVFRARFLEESRIAASLNHPNVIPIYDMGSQGDLLYIAMRYVSGTDMRQMIKKRGRLRPDTALFLIGQAARALDAAHRKGLVHRDVKPGNLLVERGDDEGDPDHVYLADFGITKHAMSRSGLTSTGQFLGTIDYVAPEQIRGMSVLGLADQYSLGCVLYECLTGRVPFEKDLDAAIIWAHVEEMPTMPTILRPELPPEVDKVFGRVLAKRPDERYGSCREFVEAARHALGIPDTGSPSSANSGILTGAPLPGLPSASLPGGSLPPASQSHEPGDKRWWSNVASPSRAGDPAAPGSRPVVPDNQAAFGSGSLESGAGTGSGAGGAPVGDGSGTLTSHRRLRGSAGDGDPGQPGGAPPPSGRPPRRRWFLRPAWLAVLIVLVLVGAGAGTWAGLHGGSKPKAAGKMAMPSMSAKPKAAATSALMTAVKVANESAGSIGMLPTSTCKQQGATDVTCASPSLGVTAVDFKTYPSLTALYDAYTAQVKQLNSGKFQQNFSDCGSGETFGEVGWNHLLQHPKNYTVAEMSMGKVTEDQAAGRVFCTYTGGYEYMLWTQDAGNMLALVEGPVHNDVWLWWAAVHHNIGLGGSKPMDMAGM
jgi:serine/threonine protein kinase